MKLIIGKETEEVGKVESIQLSKGTDSNWRLYLKLSGRKVIRHFNLDKVLENQEIKPELIEVFAATEGKTLHPKEEVTAKS